jgi:sugar/nucleoside kinase (ribokinase family)
VGAVGDDDAGALIRSGLEREGVDTRLLRTVPGMASALSIGLIRPAPDRTRTLVAAAGPPCPAIDDEIEAACSEADWVHVDHAGWALARELRRRQAQVNLSVDGGNAIDGLELAGVELYAPSVSQLLRVTGRSDLDEALDRSLDLGAAMTVATRGERGSSAASSMDPNLADVSRVVGRGSRDGAGTRWRVDVEGSPAAGDSTLGAGDVYHGALLAALVRGRSLAESMRYASAAAAISCRALDGRSGIPVHEETEAYVMVRSKGVPGAAGARTWVSA